MRVLLVVADALRADHLSCYGYPWATSPHIDELAAVGTRFEYFFAPNIPTEPAHTSIFTGEHAARHGVMVHKEPSARPRRGAAWLQAVLKANGVRTVAFDNLGDARAWFAQGWSEYHNLRHAKALLRAEDINAELIPWLRRNPKGPWFCFVHYWDPHSPYLSPAEHWQRYYEGDPWQLGRDGKDGLELWRGQPSFAFAEQWQVRFYEPFRDIDYVRALYDGEISYLDEQLEPVVDELMSSGEDFVVLFTADHGEVMYDRPGFFDHAGLYDDTVRVPLVAMGTGWPKGHIVTGMYQHIDIAPTVLRLLGATVPASMVGKDLLQAACSERAAAGYDAIYLSEGTWEIKWGLRTADWKLIKVIDPGVHGAADDELFDLVADPGERCNVATTQQETFDRLELALRRAWDELLDGRADPLRRQARRGVPALQWVERAALENAAAPLGRA